MHSRRSWLAACRRSSYHMGRLPTLRLPTFRAKMADLRGLVAEGYARKMLDQVAQQSVRQAFFVSPGRVAEDAVQRIGAGRFDPTHGLL